jgi:putative ABC transport system permease protein
MLSIVLGVGALVAVHSFRVDVTRSIQQESRRLLGADLRFTSSRPFPDSVMALVDSLSKMPGGEESRVTTLLSMAFAPANGATRLVQVRAVEGAFPLYGQVRSDPADAWSELGRPGRAVVDPAVLIQLEVGTGDTLSVGLARVEIVGTVADVPTDLAFQTAIGPRVFVSASDLQRSGLLSTGSLVRHQLFLRVPGEVDVETFLDERRGLLRAQRVGAVTAQDYAEDLASGLEVLGRFLALVGLGALLLGGVGVASAVHVFVKEKLTAVAVLRCLGAGQAGVFSAYLLQAGGLGLIGSILGVLLGIGVQRMLPVVLADYLPVPVAPFPNLAAILAGLGTGLWVALAFSLDPLMTVRDVTPLHALRREFEPERSRLDPVRLGVWTVLVLSILFLSVWQAPRPMVGLAFAGALAVTLAVLGLVATLLIRASRRFLPGAASYAVRQGFANLFRPRNQTVAVVLALGFGVFVVATVFLVEGSLLQGLSFETGEQRSNLLLFDIQEDQTTGVRDQLIQGGAEGVELTPIVPARIASLKGRRVEELLADSVARGPERWAVRRQYRNTFRGHLADTEEIVRGSWWDEGPSPVSGGERPARISVESELAEDLDVEVGDRIGWDVQGVEIETVVASIRRVDWNRFAPNFFVVFEEGALEEAPRSYVALAHAGTEEQRARVQRDLVRAFPNVSVLDLTLVQETVDVILSRVSRAVRAMAAFSLVAGVLVLIGSLATSRFQRMRESALLRTLGAERTLIVRILLTEYVALGALAATGGLLLAGISSWLLVRFLFDFDFALRAPGLLAIWAGAGVLTLAAGVLNSRGVLGRPPLVVLRDATE